jgi:hypothetical protein
MKIWRATTPVCAALLLLQGAPLLAQTVEQKAAPGETAEMTDKARELYNAGSTALLKGRWGEAHANLFAAWSLKKHHQIAGNLGAAEMQLGRYREAAEHLLYYLREAPTTKEKERKSAQAFLTEARKHIGALVIKAEPAGAEVLVDGAPVGNAPLAGEVFVDPGPRTIEARLDGYKPAKVMVEIAAGSSREVPLQLVKINVGAEGADSAATKKGNGSAAFEGEGRASRGEEIERGESGPHKGVIIAGIATGVVAIGAGIGFAVASNAHASDAERQRAALIPKGASACSSPDPAVECRDVESSLAAEGTFGNLSIMSFIAGGAVGAGTVIYALTAPRAKRSRAVSATPVVTARSGGVVITGRW